MTRGGGHVHGTRRECTSDKRHYDTQAAALAALGRIQDKGEARLYMPTGVIRCEAGCGKHVLTSKSGGGFASGKRSRRGRAVTRSR